MAHIVYILALDETVCGVILKTPAKPPFPCAPSAPPGWSPTLCQQQPLMQVAPLFVIGIWLRCLLVCHSMAFTAPAALLLPSSLPPKTKVLTCRRPSHLHPLWSHCKCEGFSMQVR